MRVRAGAEVIYQGVLFDGVRRRGYSDFLHRVERSSELGSFSYEVADTKLARRVKPYFLLQLCLYSELVEAIQGIQPARMHIVLGTRESQAFRVAEFAAYYRSVKHGFEDVVGADLSTTYPEPVEHSGSISPPTAVPDADVEPLLTGSWLRRREAILSAQHREPHLAAIERACGYGLGPSDGGRLHTSKNPHGFG